MVAALYEQFFLAGIPEMHYDEWYQIPSPAVTTSTEHYKSPMVKLRVSGLLLKDLYFHETFILTQATQGNDIGDASTHLRLT